MLPPPPRKALVDGNIHQGFLAGGPVYLTVYLTGAISAALRDDSINRARGAIWKSTTMRSRGQPYVYERQVEYWTNVQIEYDLMHQGFEVYCYPVTQLLERTLGVDVLFTADQVKLFGLQHKVLYHGAQDDYWPLTPSHQLALLQATDWAYYCLSDVMTLHDRRRALALARFAEPSLFGDSQKRQRSSDFRGYSRWGAFQNQLSSCRRGTLVRSVGHLEELLGEGAEVLEIIDSIVLMAWRAERSGVVAPHSAVVANQVLPGADTRRDADDT